MSSLHVHYTFVCTSAHVFLPFGHTYGNQCGLSYSLNCPSHFSVEKNILLTSLDKALFSSFYQHHLVHNAAKMVQDQIFYDLKRSAS